jgi:lipid-A-disaccharide synthase
VKVTFVGHPLLETVKVTQDREAVLGQLGLDPAKRSIALLPGSRRGEVTRLLPVMRDAAMRLRQEWSVQFFCVRASTVEAREIDSILKNPEIPIPIIHEHRYDAMRAADLVWTASGTATLETALLTRPMIVVYRMSWLTYLLARLLVRVEHIGMVNLIAGERLVPELVQSAVTPDRLVEESRRLLNDGEPRVGIIEKLNKLRGHLGSPGAADRVAQLALGLMT